LEKISKSGNWDIIKGVLIYPEVEQGLEDEDDEEDNCEKFLRIEGSNYELSEA
jgi:hypothetical protein